MVKFTNTYVIPSELTLTGLVSSKLTLTGLEHYGLTAKYANKDWINYLYHYLLSCEKGFAKFTKEDIDSRYLINGTIDQYAVIYMITCTLLTLSS